MNSNDINTRKEIAFALADSLDTRASKLLIGFHKCLNPPCLKDNPRGVIFKSQAALKDMIIRYSQLNDPKIENCVSFITDPEPEHIITNDEKVDFIIYGLDLKNTSENFQTILANSAIKHGSKAMLKLIERWNYNKNSEGLLNAIKLFDQKAVNYLGNLIVDDKNTIELLARIGPPAISLMKKKMRNNEQSVRFAAGDVLVKMIDYHPSALISLTSAIDQNGIRTIAKNYPFYIRLGQQGSEQILLKALRRNFSTDMCVDYLNCGSEILENGATKIAKENGYTVYPGFGGHSGPRWGSGN